MPKHFVAFLYEPGRLSQVAKVGRRFDFVGATYKTAQAASDALAEEMPQLRQQGVLGKVQGYVAEVDGNGILLGVYAFTPSERTQNPRKKRKGSARRRNPEADAAAEYGEKVLENRPSGTTQADVLRGVVKAGKFGRKEVLGVAPAVPSAEKTRRAEAAAVRQAAAASVRRKVTELVREHGTPDAAVQALEARIERREEQLKGITNKASQRSVKEALIVDKQTLKAARKMADACPPCTGKPRKRKKAGCAETPKAPRPAKQPKAPKAAKSKKERPVKQPKAPKAAKSKGSGKLSEAEQEAKAAEAVKGALKDLLAEA